MRVDNRIFLPVVGPFLLVALARGISWFGGVSWAEIGDHNKGFILFLCTIAGVALGFLAALILHEEKISLGSFTIGRANK